MTTPLHIAVGTWLHLGRAEGAAEALRGEAEGMRTVLVTFSEHVTKQLGELPPEQGWVVAFATAPWRDALEKLVQNAEQLGAQQADRAEQLRRPARAAFGSLEQQGLADRARAALTGAVAGWRGSGPRR